MTELICSKYLNPDNTSGMRRFAEQNNPANVNIIHYPS